MITSSKAHLGLIALAAIVVTLVFVIRRTPNSIVTEPAAFTEESTELRASVVLCDLAHQLAATDPRARLSDRRSIPVGDVSAKRAQASHRADVAQAAIDAMRPGLGSPEIDAASFFNQIAINALSEDMKVFAPVSMANTTLQMSEVRLQRATDVLVDYERKWKKLCGDAGSAERVRSTDADTLRTQRRDDLALVTGYAQADALLAAIQGNLGF